MKPWGTCHAVLAARKEVDGPFAVINSDDYYGPEAFREIYRYLDAFVSVFHAASGEVPALSSLPVTASM